MFLYNVTYIVEDTVLEDWRNWMQTEHLPKVMATGKFTDHKSWRIINSPNEGTTFSNQFLFEKLEEYVEFTQVFAPAIEAEIHEKYGESVLSFTSIMQDVL